jgi:hypothetical protein
MPSCVLCRGHTCTGFAKACPTLPRILLRLGFCSNALASKRGERRPRHDGVTPSAHLHNPSGRKRIHDSPSLNIYVAVRKVFEYRACSAVIAESDLNLSSTRRELGRFRRCANRDNRAQLSRLPPPTTTPPIGPPMSKITSLSPHGTRRASGAYHRILCLIGVRLWLGSHFTETGVFGSCFYVYLDGGLD